VCHPEAVSDAEKPDSRRRPDWRGPVKTVRLGIALVHSAAPRELWLTLALTVFGSLLTAAELLVGRELVNLLVDADNASASELVPWLVLLGITLVATALVTTGLNELRILTSELVHRRAMDQLLEVTTAVELEAFEDPTFHDRIRLAREHADTYAWEVVWGLVTLMTTAFQSIAVGLVLLSVAPLLVPVAFVAFIPISYVSVRNTKALYRLHYDLAEDDRDRTYHERLLTDRLEAREVRAFGLADWLRSRHDALFAERVRNTRRVVKRRTWRALVGSSITSVILVASLAAVMLFALDDRISVADATIAIVALQQLSSRLRSSGGAMESLVEGVTYLRDFETFRALLPGIATGTAARRTATAPSEIALHGVGYRYPAGADDVLHDISLTIHPGQVIAIVGPNGAGKSTLAKLLCGLLPPTSGRICWDGADIADYSPASIRAHVTPVFQDFTRFEHSAREAIGFGDIDRLDDDDGIRQAAQRAGADGFIEALPAGYDTRLSTSFTDGTELSVGQWQRVAVARAFFRDAPLIVMDEPAAALDALAERDLFERLAVLGQDRMVVFISHRFATVRRADQILVLLDGRIVERGAHDELMAVGGVYAELYSIQSEQFS
jgi:ATP-binding cassette subfamily B protein